MDNKILMEKLEQIEELIISTGRGLSYDQEAIRKNLQKALENIFVAQKRTRVK